jgi:hypothetical protein
VWMSWHEAETKDGYDVLFAQVQAGTLQTRPHPRLPASAAISWPRNLQVRYQTERELKIKSVTDTDENIVEADDAEASKSFDDAFAMRKLKVGVHPAPSVTSSAASSLPDGMLGAAALPSAEEIRDKACVQHIRKAHNAWDKAKREFQSVMAQSATHENTKGCKFEADLAMNLKKGDADDEDLVRLEQKFMRNERFTSDEVEHSARLSKELKDIIKAGNKIVQAMKPWFHI